MAKWVYLFKEGNAQMRNLLGGKGANLAEMTGLGLPVPQGLYLSQQRPAPSTTRTDRKSTMRSWDRSTSISARWKRSPARSSVTRRIRCWYPFVPVPGIHAGYDGHHSEPGSERDRSKRNRREIRQSPLGMGLLSEIYSDVL